MDNVGATGCHAFAEEVLDAWLNGEWFDPRGGTEFIPPSGDHHRAGWRLMMQSHFSAGKWLTGFAPLASVFPFYPQVGSVGAGETPVGVFELCADADGADITGGPLPTSFSTEDPDGAGPDLGLPIDGPVDGSDLAASGQTVTLPPGFTGTQQEYVAFCRQSARTAGALLLEFVDHHGEPLTPGRFPRYIPHERQAWVSTLVTKYTASPSTNVDSTPGVGGPDATVSDITGARISQVFRTQHNFVTQENPLIQQHGVAVWFSMSDESGNGCAGGWCKWSWNPVSGQLCRINANPGNDTIEDLCVDANLTAGELANRSNVKTVAAIHDNPGAGGPGYEAESIGDGDGLCEGDGQGSGVDEPCAGGDGIAGNGDDTGDDDGVCELGETDCYGNVFAAGDAIPIDLDGDGITDATGNPCGSGDFCRRGIGTVEKAPSEIYQTLGQWVDLAGPATGGVWGSSGVTNQNQALWTEFWGLSGPNFQSEEGVNPNTWLKCGTQEGDVAGCASDGDDGDTICEGDGAGFPGIDEPCTGPDGAPGGGDDISDGDGLCEGFSLLFPNGETCTGPGDADYTFENNTDAMGNDDGICDPAEAAVAGQCRTYKNTLLAITIFGNDPINRWGDDMAPENAQDLGCTQGDAAVGSCTDKICAAASTACDRGVFSATVICVSGGDADRDPRTAACTSTAGGNGVYGDDDDLDAIDGADNALGTSDDLTVYYKEVIEEGLRGFLRHNRTISFSFANGAGGGHDGNLSGTMRQIMAQNLADGMTLSCLNCEGDSDHFVQNHRVPSYTFSFDVSGVDFVEHSSITPGSGVIP
jgi:hypothetical protein